MTNLYAESALVSKVLGALFYYRPTDYAEHGIEHVLNYQSGAKNCSELLVQFGKTLAQFKQSDIESLSMVHDEFFAGISDMPVPPWGSVYLDRECVLFGESTTQYKQYLTELGFEFNTHNNDPLDHIGLMLMVLGEVLEMQLEQDTKNELHRLLGFHLLPWSTHYLAQLTPRIPSGAYSSLIGLTQSLLSQLQNELNVQVEVRKVYFNVQPH
ncbi:molecular chaperone TorD family protein [Vibrio rumoiensis]|uniref:Dehydrogenase n=1 Tax=Vibrio rumoiensis 1S-45 TaxID=1188252 RepID=A0A1E5E2J4_9VIBR|nr:molecular chaperone TorD family protein [Vibrio rumoiensis]OEF25739.1 hypothetical protein A1QC_08205 [Vibrio rumoiensis 1S-45]